MTISIVPKHDMSAAEIEVIDEHLYDHNQRATGRDDAEGLAFVASDATGRVVGAATGYSWAGIAELKLLWVEEGHRNLGHGRQLLSAFIEEASRRDLHRVWVSSHDFQAPELYERAGFDRVAELPGWPEGHQNVILCKTLRPQDQAS